MSQLTSVKFNILQNLEDFELEPIFKQAPLFKFGYALKTLDPPRSNPEDLDNYKIVTVKCLYKGCK